MFCEFVGQPVPSIIGNCAVVDPSFLRFPSRGSRCRRASGLIIFRFSSPPRRRRRIPDQPKKTPVLHAMRNNLVVSAGEHLIRWRIGPAAAVLVCVVVQDAATSPSIVRKVRKAGLRHPLNRRCIHQNMVVDDCTVGGAFLVTA